MMRAAKVIRERPKSCTGRIWGDQLMTCENERAEGESGREKERGGREQDPKRSCAGQKGGDCFDRR